MSRIIHIQINDSEAPPATPARTAPALRLPDGTVVTGPATRALAKKDVTVESGRLTLA